VPQQCWKHKLSQHSTSASLQVLHPTQQTQGTEDKLLVAHRGRRRELFVVGNPARWACSQLVIHGEYPITPL